MSWMKVCELTDIAPDTGVCALVNNRQVAIFRQASTDRLFAIDNFDPIGQANVLSRGLTAQLSGKNVVASPLYKQHYCLETGSCLEDDSVSVDVYQVRNNGGDIEVCA
jgi:nitrite reductase (NADH) small subunit